MASSNIKLFDENKGNMLTDTEFNISTQRLNGLQTGVASSQLQNKAMYQASLMAYAIAQLMLANGKNANDTDAVSTFVNNLLASIVQKVADKATKQDIEAGTIGKWISSELLKSNNEDIASTYLKLAGGTMLGDLFLKADPTSALQAVTKQYVDNNFMKVSIVEYTGTGTYGVRKANTLNFPYPVKFIVLPYTRNLGMQNSFFLDDLSDTAFKTVTAFHTASSAEIHFKRSTDYKTVTWYNTDSAEEQLNTKDRKYEFLIFGYDN